MALGAVGALCPQDLISHLAGLEPVTTPTPMPGVETEAQRHRVTLGPQSQSTNGRNLMLREVLGYTEGAM